MQALTVFLLGGLAFLFYLLGRNAAVFSYRMSVLNRSRITGSLDEYNALPSYNAMMYKFWVWPLSRFENKPVPKTNLKMVK